jgi:hypothetical protein
MLGNYGIVVNLFWDQEERMARARQTKSELTKSELTTVSFIGRRADGSWIARAGGTASGTVPSGETGGRRDKAVQTSLRLSRAAYDYVAKAAEQNGCGVGEEIRRRLEVTFTQDLHHVDEETHRLTGAIVQVACNINSAFGPWHQDRFSFEVFKAAITTLLVFQRPRGAPVPPSDADKVELYLGPDGTPETAGRMFAVSVAIAEGIPIPGELRQAPTQRGERR